MAPARNLSERDLKIALAMLPGWSIKRGKLHRKYEFADFVEAFGFMASAALFIERMNHHPEWLNVYGKLTIDLATHDTKGITHRDVDLAGKLEALARKRGAAGGKEARAS